MFKIFNRQYNEKDPRLDILINKSDQTIFDVLKPYFKHIDMNSSKKIFEYDSHNIFYIFDSLNSHFFKNVLLRPQFSICSANDLKLILKQMNKNELAGFDYYAMYLPQYITENKNMVKDTIFIVDSYGKMSFKFAVSCMMHEMIHLYDIKHGMLKHIVETGSYSDNIEHRTPDFKNFMHIAATEGLKIMQTGNNIGFDKLNDEIANFKPLTEEDAEDGWKKMVDRLKAGENIPNVALTPDGNVAFIL